MTWSEGESQHTCLDKQICHKHRSLCASLQHANSQPKFNRFDTCIRHFTCSHIVMFSCNTTRTPNSQLDTRCSNRAEVRCCADVEPSHHNTAKASLVDGSSSRGLSQQNQSLQRNGAAAVLACDALASSDNWHLQGDVQIQVNHLLWLLCMRCFISERARHSLVYLTWQQVLPKDRAQPSASLLGTPMILCFHMISSQHRCSSK